MSPSAPGFRLRLRISLMVLLCCGCRCAEPKADMVSMDAGVEQRASCERLEPSLFLSSASGSGDVASSAEALDVPFGIELGDAVAVDEGYLLTALAQDASGFQAYLAYVPRLDAPAARVSLGALHGDARPPRLLVTSSGPWVGVFEPDASGTSLRVAGVRVAGGLRVGPFQLGPHQGGDESSAVDWAAAGTAALVVWDEWRRAENRGVIVASALGLGGELQGPVKTLVDRTGVDAEGPRVVERPGGFWLLWVENAPLERHVVYDPDAPMRGSNDSRAFGARWLQLQPLDTKGQPTAEPIAVSPRQERVVAYELSTGPDGAAWVAYRQGAASPSASGGQWRVAAVRMDGTQSAHPVVSEHSAVGEPVWLGPRGTADQWLELADEREQAWLLPVPGVPFGDEQPRALPRTLGVVSVLEARAGEWLMAAPRGAGVEVFRATCHWP